VQKGVVTRSHPTTPLINIKHGYDIDAHRGTLCIITSKRSSGHFAFSSQTQSDKRFPKHMSRLPNCANPLCVRSHWEKRISQLRLIKSHNHVAREIGGSSHVFVEDIVSQFAKKDQKDKV